MDPAAFAAFKEDPQMIMCHNSLSKNAFRSIETFSSYGSFGVYHSLGNGLSVSIFKSGRSIPPREFPKIITGRYNPADMIFPVRNK